MNRVLHSPLSALALASVIWAGAAPAQAAPASDYSNAPEMRRLLHWPRFPLRVWFTPEVSANGEREAAVREGLDEWVRATRNFVQYQIVADPAQADVTVTLLPEAAVPDRDGATGNTRLTFSGLVLKKALIRVATAGATPADLQATAAHEFGHALGIDGHSDDADDLMFPVLVRTTPLLATDQPDLPPAPHDPTKRDLNTLKICYPALALSLPPNPPH